MRAEWVLLLLGLSGPALAAEADDGDTQPDAALLEFLADWQEDDQSWLDAEMSNEQSGDAAQDASAQETNHD